jgi:hypothetical protein
MSAPLESTNRQLESRSLLRSDLPIGCGFDPEQNRISEL